MKQANQIIPEFFSGGSGACVEAEQFGGSDIRQPATNGGQVENDEW